MDKVTSCCHVQIVIRICEVIRHLAMIRMGASRAMDSYCHPKVLNSRLIVLFFRRITEKIERTMV